MTSGGKLNGLVLAGGKSQRMGEDKSTIKWHGIEQKYYIADLLKPLCDTIYISYRESTASEDNGYKVLTDSHTGIGPYGAILSAFEKEPDAAWLVIACDLPLMDRAALRHLVEGRKQDCIATAYLGPDDNLPEPLIAIWEPQSYSHLLALLNEGVKCPRKALIRSDNVNLLRTSDAHTLMNVNTPEDAARARDIIAARNSSDKQDKYARYNCQVKLPGFGTEAQEKLGQARVLIAGAGGLGCPVAQYLVAAGIGTVGIADNDLVSVSNLHRQILYDEKDTGHKKVTAAAHKLQEQNANVNIVAHDLRITTENVADLIHDYDLVVDCTDNFATRYLLNDACILSGKPLVYGAIFRYEGQVAVWNMPNKDGSRTPNYRDVFTDVNPAAVPDCTEGGVLPTLAGVIGSMQANEVIKVIIGVGDVLASKLLIWDALHMQQRVIALGSVTKAEIKSLPGTSNKNVISATDLKAGMKASAYYLVDVRTAEEHADYNIGGVNLPLSELLYGTAGLQARSPVVFYCLTGSRSRKAVDIIRTHFPEIEVFSLEGGIQDWVTS